MDFSLHFKLSKIGNKTEIVNTTSILKLYLTFFWCVNQISSTSVYSHSNLELGQCPLDSFGYVEHISSSNGPEQAQVP